MKRQAVAAGLLAAVVGSAAVGWFAGRQVASPAEVAARTEAPTASRITVAVEQQVLSSTLIVRGLVRYGEPKPVVLPQSSVKGPAAVVTEPAVKGAVLDDGAKALDLGGRPVFVLEGALPMYRDLRPDDSGVDVEQLEAGLARLGFEPGAVDGTFDKATSEAVARWYRSKGYDPFEPTDAQTQQLRNARDALSRAKDSVLQAERSLDAALSPDKKLQLRENATSSGERVAAARTSAQRDLSRAEIEVRVRKAAVESARVSAQSAQLAADRAMRDKDDPTISEDADQALRDARQQVTDAERSVLTAKQAVDDARVSLEEAKRTAANAAIDRDDANAAVGSAEKTLADAKKGRVVYGNDVSQISVVVSASEVESAEQNVRSTQSRVRQAETALRQAENAISVRERAVADAEIGVTKAESAVTRANQAVARAQRGTDKSLSSLSDRAANADELLARARLAETEVGRAELELQQAEASLIDVKRSGQAAIRQAEAARNIAQVSVSESNRGADVRASRQQLETAKSNVVVTQSDVEDLERRVGFSVPANELLFFPSLPLRVDDTKINRGDPVNGAVMTVTTSRLAVDSALETADAKLVSLGSKVEIEAAEFNITITGTVTELAETPGTKGVENTQVYLEVTPEPGPNADASSLNGASVKLTIPVRSTGTEVLTVPVAALSVGANAESRVEVEDSPDRATRFVTVTPGLSADGMVAITVKSGKLQAGDRVVVGTQRSELDEVPDTSGG